MNRLIAMLALSLALAAPTLAQAQAQASGNIKPAQAPAASAPAAAPAAPAAAAPAPAPVSAAAVPGAGPAVPNVESVDILKQDQVARTRDQPGNLSPTWRAVKENTVPNYSSLPYKEASVLIQPKAQFPGQAKATTAGEAWRQYRNGPLTVYGGWLIVLVLVAIAVVYFALGKIRLHAPLSGRLIERFTSLERMVHWTMAISFVLLAVSGLIMLFGKYILLPVFGHTLFGWLSFALKNIHNFVGPVFTVSVIVAFIIFVRDNLPAAGDIKWLMTLGGMFSKKGHVPSGRFNAGEKLWFWGGMVFLGLVLTASGFFLDMIVPAVEYTRGNMQIANLIHLAGAVLMVCASFGHIYMGTVGMEGAYDAMRTGYVDDTWAREHHELWYDDVASGRVPRVRTEEGASVVGAPARISS